jgi:hypothetical protein
VAEIADMRRPPASFKEGYIKEGYIGRVGIGTLKEKSLHKGCRFATLFGFWLSINHDVAPSVRQKSFCG